MRPTGFSLRGRVWSRSSSELDSRHGHGFVTGEERSTGLLSGLSIMARPACRSPGRYREEPASRRHLAAMPCLPAVDLNVAADVARKQANVRTSELPLSAASRA